MENTRVSMVSVPIASRNWIYIRYGVPSSLYVHPTNYYLSLAALGRSIPSQYGRMLPILPIIALLSIFWAAWDPTYASYRKALHQGRQARVNGKFIYNVRISTYSYFLCTQVDKYPDRTNDLLRFTASNRDPASYP